MKKKGSLNLSINAVVVIVLAIVMLGLGLGFIRGIFGQGLSQVEDQLKQLENQRIDSLKANCDDELCLETKKVDLDKKVEKHIWMAINNRFDCELEYIEISVAGVPGGSDQFDDDSCVIIGSQGQCSDVSIETRPVLSLRPKEEETVILILNAASEASTTVYSYDVSVKGQCSMGNVDFYLDDKVTLDVNVKG